MGQRPMGGGAVNEPDRRSQQFGETWLEPEELCYQSDWRLGWKLPCTRRIQSLVWCHGQEGK
jgi:hypothetical protein